MKQALLTIFSFFIFGLSFSQEKQIIETTDIDNFWIAFDKLKSATTQNDSIEIIQTNYIDQSTEYFKEFIKLRNFTAEEYVKLIGKYPRFWNSIRKETEKVKHRKDEIEKVLDIYEKAFKENAVKLSRDRKNVSELAYELGIEPFLLYRWRKEFQENGESAFSGKGNAILSEERKKIIELEKSLREVEIERDILKKALSIISKSGR